MSSAGSDYLNISTLPTAGGRPFLGRPGPHSGGASIDFRAPATSAIPSSTLTTRAADPFRPTDKGGVECDEAKMENHRPYPFKVGGVWFVAVKHSENEGDVGLYQLVR